MALEVRREASIFPETLFFSYLLKKRNLRASFEVILESVVSCDSAVSAVARSLMIDATERRAENSLL